MKLKQILAGLLSAAMVVTSVPVAGFGSSVALADESPSDTKYIYMRLTPDDSWTATTDAGSTSGKDIDQILDEGGTEWKSLEQGQENGPVEDTELVQTNRIYLDLPEDKTSVGKFVYYGRYNNGEDGANNGRIKNAAVYVVDKDTNTETQVVSPETAWTYDDTNASADNLPKVEFTFDSVKTNVKQVIIEVKHTDGTAGGGSSKR